MDHYSDDFWKSSERSIQDDFPFLSLSSNENQQNNNVVEQADGDASEGGSMEIDQLQGSLIHNGQNDPQQQAFLQSGAMAYGDQYPEIGSPMLPQASMPLMAVHQNDPQYGINQVQEEPSNTINFLDRDMPPQGRRLNERMPFINLSGAINRGVSQSVGVTASFLSPEAYNQVQLSNPMPMNAQNDGIGSSNFYSQLLNRNINMKFFHLEQGGRTYGRSMARDSQTWEDPELRDILMQQPAAYSAKRPIPNSLYDPRYEQLGLPVDPHLRHFLAEKACEFLASTSKKKTG